MSNKSIYIVTSEKWGNYSKGEELEMYKSTGDAIARKGFVKLKSKRKTKTKKED